MNLPRRAPRITLSVLAASAAFALAAAATNAAPMYPPGPTVAQPFPPGPTMAAGADTWEDGPASILIIEDAAPSADTAQDGLLPGPLSLQPCL